MNETRFPAGPPSPGRSTRSAGGNEPNARLVNVPNEVRAEVQTRKAVLRLRGEVVRHNDDGSIRVRTQRGDIDVRLREGQPKPERGAPVEVEIPPAKADGRVPETASVREVLRGETPTAAPEHRTSATPLEVEVRPPQGEAAAPRQPLPAEERHRANAAERAASNAANAANAASQALPPIGTAVRLQPLSPRAAARLPVQDLLPQVVQSVIAPAVFEAQIVAAQVQSDTAQAVVTSFKPVIGDTPAPLTQTFSTPLVTTAPPLPPNTAPKTASVILTQPVAFSSIETPALQTGLPRPFPQKRLQFCSFHCARRKRCYPRLCPRLTCHRHQAPLFSIKRLR